LLDAYGELLTEKQRDFLRRYYEEDFSFGEIAREASVSRQAVFDSVKHGEAALENYEHVLGLVGSGGGNASDGAVRRSDQNAERAEAAAEHLRRWIREASREGSASDRTGELETLADDLESLAEDLKRAGRETRRDSLVTAGGAGSGRPTLDGRASLVLRDGPEVD
jgi:hypothetical protein